MRSTGKFYKVEQEKWPHKVNNLIAVFQNYDFLVQIFEEHGHIRLTINRTEYTIQKGQPIWRDRIHWDEILEIKKALGYDEYWGVECYPPEKHFVNDANMRHIFLFKEKPSWCWEK